MSQLLEDAHYRYRRRTTSDISPIKYEGWKRSLKGSAVTKYLWNMSGILVHVDWYSPLDGMMTADVKWVARLLLIHQHLSSAYKTDWSVSVWVTQMLGIKNRYTSDPEMQSHSWATLYVYWCYNSALALVWALQGKYSVIGTTMVSFSAKTRKEAADLKKILYP